MKVDIFMQVRVDMLKSGLIELLILNFVHVIADILQINVLF